MVTTPGRVLHPGTTSGHGQVNDCSRNAGWGLALPSLPSLPSFHGRRPRIPPRGQRQQAETVLATPGHSEVRGACSQTRSKARKAAAIFSRTAPTACAREGKRSIGPQPGAPNWIRPLPELREGGSRPFLCPHPPSRHFSWYAPRWRPPWCGAGCCWLGGSACLLTVPRQVGGCCLGRAASLGSLLFYSLKEGGDGLSTRE
jgi:hypothetical protein